MGSAEPQPFWQHSFSLWTAVVKHKITKPIRVILNVDSLALIGEIMVADDAHVSKEEDWRVYEGESVS